MIGGSKINEKSISTTATVSILILGIKSSEIEVLLKQLRQKYTEINVQYANDLHLMKMALEQRQFDLILSEYETNDYQALLALQFFQEQALDIPFIILSDIPDEESIVESLYKGATDVLATDQLSRLMIVIERELSHARTRQQLKQAESRFTKVFENSPVGIIISRTSDRTIVDVNQKCTDMFGYDRDSLIGKTGSDLGVWAKPEQFEQVVQMMESLGMAQNIEIELRRSTGEIVFVLYSAHMIELQNEICVLTMIHDITDRKMTEIALEKREQQFRLLAENSTDMIAKHTVQGVFMYVSPASRILLGYEPEELLGRSSYEFFHPEDINNIIQTHDSVLSGADVYTIDYRMRRKDGTYIWFESNCHSVRDPNTQQVVEIQSSSRDVSERKRLHAEEHIRRLFAEALQETVTSILDGSIGLDELLKRLLDQAASLVPCDSATLMLVENNVAYVAHSTGYSDVHQNMVKRIALEIPQIYNFQEMARNRRPLMIPDTSEYANWRHDILSELPPVRAYLGVPIFIGDQLLGFINLQSYVPYHFSVEHTARIEILTGQAAIAVHNAQLYEHIQRDTERLRILHEIDTAILQSVEPRIIAFKVLEQLKPLIHHHSASITLFDLEKEQFTVLATTFATKALLSDKDTHPIENKPIIEHLAQNNIYILNDLQNAENRTNFDIKLREMGVRSYARIPLISRNKLLGSINFRALKPNAFSKENLEIAREIAAQLAIALENARLLEIETRRNTELTALHQASLQLTSTLDLDIVFKTILDYSILMVDAYDAHIFLYKDGEITFGAAHWDGKHQDGPVAVPRLNGLTYTVARSGERIIVPDMQNHPLYPDTHWHGAIIGLPLRFAGTVTGVMSLAFNETHDFQEQELRLLELFADQVAIAIHNAQLYSEIQTYADELEQRVLQRTQQFQRAKNRVEAILHSSSDFIVLIDVNGNIYQSNPSADAKFAYKADYLLDKPLSTLISEEYVSQFENTLKQVIKDKEDRRVEILMQGANGMRFPADALISAFEDGDELAIVCSLRDITLQKQVESELRQALEKQIELNELKTNFTSLVSHEFRTPIAAILSTAELLIKHSNRMEPENRLNKLHNISRQVERLTELIDNFLVFTRSESVGFTFNPAPVNLLRLSNDIIEEVQVGQKNDVTISFDSTGLCNNVVVDEFLFTHILQNLLSNAIKYSLQDGKVFVKITCDETKVILHVIDEGIGIPEHDKENLFSSFHRASNVGQIKGTGIGLTIVKRAIDAYGGQIELESNVGHGTKFVVTLPI